MTFLRNLSIRKRLWLILTIALCGLVLTEIKALHSIHDSLYEAEYTAKRETVKTYVNSAWSLVDHYHTLYTDGVLSEQQAQQAALDALRAMHDDTLYFWVSDARPVLLMNAGKPSSEGTSMLDIRDQEGTAVFTNMVRLARGNREGIYLSYLWPLPGETTPRNKTSFIRHYPDWDWYVGSGLYPADVGAIFMEKAAGLASITLGFIVLMAFAIRLVSASIDQPLTRLSETMSRIAEGDGDLTQRLTARGNDELSRLADSFNHFIARIQDIIRESKSATGQVAASGADIASLSKATRKLTSDQREDSEHVASSAREMSQTIREIAGNAEQAASAVRSVETNASHGLTTIQSAQKHISDLAGQIRASCQSIRNLRDETESIGSVLDVIRGIAEQTNLLALNAAIEAARAGEQGRGFAVVADEVRTLASRTQASTEEIHNTIARLQEQAATTVTSMESSSEHSETTSAMSQSACDAMTAIREAVVTLTDMNISMAAAVEQQSVAAIDISDRISRIAESSGKINHNMAQADEGSQQLQNCSDNLSDLINQFRI